MRLKIYCDGGARGNPGEAAIAVIVKDEMGKVITSLAKRLGFSSNNQAEYQAVIAALSLLKNRQDLSFSHVDIFLDSLLLVKQLNGLFKVKNAILRQMLLSIRLLEAELNIPISYRHISRQENKQADFLVNQALDNQGESKTGVSL